MTVQAVEAFSPYSNVTGYAAALPQWMSVSDAERINAYQIYEQIYWNVPDTFKLVMRGEANAQPIYIPTARTLVDTTNRYVAVRPGFIIDNDLGTPEDIALAKRMFSSLFRRERFWSKFQANKLYGVMRGDWCWHIVANPQKPLGRRIKIEAIDPAAYFPVTHPNDPDAIIAVHIVEQVMDEDENVFIRRQTYQRGADPLNNDGSDTTIYNSVGLFSIEAWQSMTDNPVTVVKPPTALPAQITAIPVYHIRNIETPGDPFGSSELRGFERILAAINQAVSDEELALALEGLGMYATDGGPPRDENNRVTDWVLGPGRVVEHSKGSKFTRINGVSSVDPVQDHLRFLINSLKEASATPDAAVGKVDVQVAESGVALKMQLQPLLAKREVREDVVVDVHEQMFYDLRAWFAAYEQYVTPCIAHPVFGDPIEGADRAERIKEVLDIVAAGIASAEWGRLQLMDLGFDFEEDEGVRMFNEAAARAVATDPFAARMNADQDEEGATDA
jgi:hypothetical protein